MTTPILKLMTSMATRDMLRELVADYQKAHTQAVETESAGGVDVAKRVHAGEAVDVIVLPRASLDKLAAEGKIHADSCVDLVLSGIAVAVRAGAPRADISSESAVKETVLAAHTLALSTGPSGAHLEKIFERWGILESLRARISVAPPGVPVGSLVASGKVELGFQQLSELMTLEGVTVLGMLPPTLQSLTTYSGAIATVSRSVTAAQRLLDYMAAPERDPLKKRHGMEPAAS